ncbi:Bpu10I family restriction endonuclease [Burkholderia vietnamiensis]|uniref:Bpu10I family restriction endonuclease n=1 Tax=Burkholderia vietnamiensis TaxID=60552 RepID=UPI001593F94A|nr:Bpu10I family restriction endonuclease [Burkholderia vietnamiensis]MCA8180975.1 Bpu10I family restriction endonuclease [Burkholderia vietnamiensis]UEB99936.1 Bpu10I family restriction endonuclease [Burkholderia vietnamiensis]
MQVSHPATHGDKLNTLLINNGLSDADRPRVQAALTRYNEWLETLRTADADGTELLNHFVTATNAYKRYIDLDLIYDSESNFLYRQNGQLKLSNTILEEFLPYLFDERLVPGFARLQNIVFGPQKSYAGLSFGSPLLNLSDTGMVFLKTKDQDFSVSRTHRLTITDEPDSGEIFSKRFCVAHFATEIKTNLDKTMFQEASQTAMELKRAVPGSRYVLLCEYLDMTPITTKLTSIDEVIVLRRAKRLASNVRANFSTSEGRQQYRDRYVEFLDSSPLHLGSFERFISHLNECFPAEEDDTVDTVLGRGYF